MTRSEKCALLEKDMTLRGFFALLCGEESAQAALWLEEGQERGYTFGQLRARAYACAARLDALGVPEGWVGLAVDTCPDWPVLFWGLVAAGRQPLLLDPSLDDAPIAHLMRKRAPGR